MGPVFKSTSLILMGLILLTVQVMAETNHDTDAQALEDTRDPQSKLEPFNPANINPRKLFHIFLKASNSTLTEEEERHIEESIEETIRTVLLQLRNQSAVQIPGVEIPDPMDVPDLNTVVQQGATNANISMWNASITGLSSFIIDEVVANLATMNTTIGLNLTNLFINGQYKLKGKYAFFLISGEGNFWLKISRAYVSGNLILSVNSEGILEVADVNLDCQVVGLRLHFENLLGTGVMSNFGNTVLNALSKGIFETAKMPILEEMQNTMKTILNEQFQSLPPQPMLAHSESPLDLAIANSAAQIRELNLDPFALPPFNQTFNRRIFRVKIFGNITLYDGYLRGLSSLHRTGEIKMAYKGNVLDAAAELGFDNLEGGYKWEINFMGLSRKGGVHFLVKTVGLNFVVTQLNELHSHPTVKVLQIQNIDRVNLDMDGLGSFDYLLEFFTNVFTNVFKKQFSRISEKQIKTVLQENLNQIQLPF